MLSHLKKHKYDIIIFLSLFFIFILFNIYFPQFPNYDFFNYRWYNSIAFVHNRYELDFFTANIRSYFNPLVDLPVFFIITKCYKHPLLLQIIFSFDSTILMFLCYKIIDFILIERKKLTILLISIFSILYSSLSPTFISLQSFDTNDIFISIFILLGFYIFLKYILYSKEKQKRNSLLCGFILGTAFGLKLTVFSYVITITLLYLIFYKKFKEPNKTILFFILGVIIGFGIFGGIWYYKIYCLFENPFFPYFNHVFKSPYSDFVNVQNLDFQHIKPNSILEFIFYPFLQPQQGFARGHDNFAWDFRIAFSYLINLILIFSLSLLHKKNKENNCFGEIITKQNIIILLIFCIVPFAINTYLFGTYRYIIASITFLGLLVITTILYFSKLWKRNKTITFLISIIILISTIIFSNYGHIEIAKSPLKEKYSGYFYQWDPYFCFKNNSTVIFLNPLSSVAMPLKKQKRVSTIGYYLPLKYRNFLKERLSAANSHVTHSSYLEKKLFELIHSDKYLYIAFHIDNNDIYVKSLEEYNKGRTIKRNISNCRKQNSLFLNENWFRFDVTICEYN